MNADEKFVHLHVHTEYSLLDGLSQIDRLMTRAEELHMPSMAITDHGTMFGVVDFFRAAVGKSIRPIIGLEAYLAKRGMEDRDGKQDLRPYHMLLLAKNQQGYRNLMKLASEAQLRGFYRVPRIDRELLAQYSEGLVATSGCLGAQIPQTIMSGHNDDARELIGWYQEVFGPENFYLELQYHDIDVLEDVNRWLAEYRRSGHTPVQFLATNDVHYVLAEDHDPHDTLLCIQTGNLKSQGNRLKMSDASYHLTSHEEMEDILTRQYSWLPDEMRFEALYNTAKVAAMCDVDLETEGYHLPLFPVPPRFESEHAYLRYLVEKGRYWRYGAAADRPLYVDRMEHELNIITTMGFDTYFLIVWDLCEFARHADIWWNVRGSGAGSLVAYCLGITNIDPIQNSLIFERFLNPGRQTMPDIDLDYPDDRRADMIEYTAQKYGSDKVAAIITFGTMGAKNSIKDVGRALDVPVHEVNEAANLIPQEAKVKPIQTYMDNNPELRQLYNNNPRLQKVIDTAKVLQGIARHASTHAAGVIVADKPLVEYIPLHRLTRGEDKDSTMQQVTQFPMETCESLGLLKVDFLGLSTLTYMRRASDLIYKHHGVRWTLSSTPYRPHEGDNLTEQQERENQMLRETFHMFGEGATVGVFQVESAGMQQMLRGMKPWKYEHIIAGVSLYRPGPMDYIPEFNDRMHGVKDVQYHHPKLEPILAETYGIITYQEQIMQIASDLFAYPMSEADLMRRAVSKKKQKELIKHKSIFLERGPENGISAEDAEKIFDDIEFFANYGFNKCLVGDTRIVDAETGRVHTIAQLYKGEARIEKTVSLDTDTMELIHRRVEDVIFNGVKPVYKLTTATGRTITATDNHPFYTEDGWQNLGELAQGDKLAVPRQLPVNGKEKSSSHVGFLARQLWNYPDEVIPDNIFELNNEMLTYIGAMFWQYDLAGYYDEPCVQKDTYSFAVPVRNQHVAQQLQHILSRIGIVANVVFDNETWIVSVTDKAMQSIFTDKILHPELAGWGFNIPESVSISRDEPQNAIYWDEVVSIEYAGEQPTYDLTIEGTHNFVANDIIVHNSHAADYAMITVQTAFLKCHYPAEYMAALLSVYRETADKVSTFLEECGRLEIPIMPPSVNHSHFDFDIQNMDDGTRGIRFGMAAIKNASTGAVQRIIDEREESGLFGDLTDFCQRVDLRQIGKRTLEALIKVGALDQFADSRSQLLGAVDQMVSYSGDHHHAKDIGQISMFGAAETGLVDEIRLPTAEPIPNRQKLNWERELLGFYVTDHPVDEIRRQIDTTHVSTSSQLSQLDEFEGEKPASMIGLISNIREITTRNGDQMAIIALEDRFGTIECVMFPRTWEGSKQVARDNQGKVVLVIGKADNRKGTVQIIANKITTEFPMYVRAEGSPAPMSVPESNGHGSDRHHNGSPDTEEPPPIDFSGYAGPGDVTEPEDEYQPVKESAQAAVQTPVYETTEASDIDWETELDGDPHINGEKVAQKTRYRITVYLQITDDDEVNVRRLRRVHNQFMQFKGDDEFMILFETAEGAYRMEFKDQSTHACDELWHAIIKIVGEQNITYDEIEGKP